MAAGERRIFSTLSYFLTSEEDLYSCRLIFNVSRDPWRFTEIATDVRILPVPMPVENSERGRLIVGPYYNLGANERLVPDLSRPSVYEVERMLEVDGQGRALEQVVTQPILGTPYFIEAGDADNGEAQFVRDVLFKPPYEGGMTTPMDTLIKQLTGAFSRRRAFFEKVWTRNADGDLVYHKIAYRPAETCSVRFDDNGSFDGFRQESIDSMGKPFELDLEPANSLVYIHDAATRPLEGRSMFASAYRNFVDKLKITQLYFYHCFTGETRFITREGVKTLAECAGSSVELMTRGSGGKGVWREAEIKHFGKQRIWDLVVSRNGRTKTIRTTSDHRWFTRNTHKARDAAGGAEREVVTKDLQPGDRLVAVRPTKRASVLKQSAIGVAHGYVFGDGTRTDYEACVNIHEENPEEILRFFPEPRVASTKYFSGEVPHVSGLPRSFKEIPREDEGPAYLYSFLSGWFAADGSIGGQGQLYLWSANREHLDWARRIGLNLGVVIGEPKSRRGGSYKPDSTLWYVTIDRATITADFFVKENHRKRYESLAFQAQPNSWRVISVEETNDTEDVYCAVVPETENFLLEDFILTGNCQNIALGSVVAKLEGGDPKAVDNLKQKAALAQGGGAVVLTGGEELEKMEWGRSADDFRNALQYLDTQMAQSFLASFITLGQYTDRGSWALSRDQSDFFLLSLESKLNELASFLTEYLIAPLVYYKFGPDASYPAFAFEPLSETRKSNALKLWSEVIGSNAINNIRPSVLDMIEDVALPMVGVDPDQVDKSEPRGNPQTLLEGPAVAGGTPSDVASAQGVLANLLNGQASPKPGETLPARGGVGYPSPQDETGSPGPSRGRGG